MRYSPSFFVLFGALGLACSSESLSGPGDDGSGSPAPGGGSADEGAAVGNVSSPVVYPEGPYGRGIGSVIENLSFLGWRDPVAAGYDTGRFEVVRLSDFYNPEGRDGAPKIIVLNASAVWCSVCRSEYRQIQSADLYSKYQPMGVEILGVLFEDVNYGPARPEDLSQWGGPNGFNIRFPLVLDPGFKTGVYFDSDATPLNMLIDATSMRILDVTMGYNSSNPDAYWRAIEAWLGG